MSIITSLVSLLLPRLCDPLPDSPPPPHSSSTPDQERTSAIGVERRASLGVTHRQDSDHDTPPRGQCLQYNTGHQNQLTRLFNISGASVGSSSSEKYSSKNNKGLDKDMPEFPFLTITKFPPGFLLHLGGMVSSKSVKLLEELDDRDEGDARESWWVEIRQEVRSHARALGCNMIVGYQEKTVIW